MSILEEAAAIKFAMYKKSCRFEEDDRGIVVSLLTSLQNVQDRELAKFVSRLPDMVCRYHN